jgi:lipase maturation factor 1
MFLPRRFRIAAFFIVTPFEIGIILTANYAFLNYIVLLLGILLLDDQFLEWILPSRLRKSEDRSRDPQPASAGPHAAWRRLLVPSEMTVAGICLALVFYVTTAKLLEELFPAISLPQGAVNLIEPFRIAQDYHLFGTMTPDRREIEFQGTFDGKTWTPYKFRYKPQDVDQAPGIYAPYQPRFEWNLWFASLGGWQQYRWVVWTEERLLRAEPDVLQLFAANPFPGGPPLRVRSVIYQYWFTDMQTRRTTGAWWRRQLLGDYAPQLERETDGRIEMLEIPGNLSPGP